MPTQQQIADHLGLNQSTVSRQLEEIGINWKVATMDEIRVLYIRHLVGVAAGHRTNDGLDLVRERVLTERVDRELKTLTVAEKKGTLVNVGQLEGELQQMVGAFRAELLARDDKLKSELDALYGVDVDLSILNDYTINALSQLARYDPSERGTRASGAGGAVAAREADHDGVGAPAPEHVGESEREAGTV